MKKDLVFKMILALLAAVSLNACSAKVDGGGSPLTPKPNSDFKDTVQSVSLDGTWKSACIGDMLNLDAYDIITMTIKDHNITRHVDVFSDAACTTATAGTRDEQGILRFLNALTGGGYALEYRFTMPNGWYESLENVRLDNGTLWISNEVGGDAVPSVQLTAVTPSTTTVHDSEM